MSVLEAHPMRTTEDHKAGQCQKNVHEHGLQFCNDFLPIEGDMIPQHRRQAAFPSGRGQWRDTFNSDLAAPLEPSPDSRLGQPPPQLGPEVPSDAWAAWLDGEKTCENPDKPRGQSTFYIVINPYSLIMKSVSLWTGEWKCLYLEGYLVTKVAELGFKQRSRFDMSRLQYIFPISFLRIQCISFSSSP